MPGLAVLGPEINRQAMMIGCTNPFALDAVVAFGALPLIALVRIRQLPA